MNETVAHVREHVGTLRWKESSILFIKFYKTNVPDIVKVHGCLGAAYYIDENKTKEEAKKYWKEKVEKGWHKCGNNEAPQRNWWFWN